MREHWVIEAGVETGQDLAKSALLPVLPMNLSDLFIEFRPLESTIRPRMVDGIMQQNRPHTAVSVAIMRLG